MQINHAGPFRDDYSKWLEVHIVPSTSSEATTSKLCLIFSTFGLPDQLVSDNGTGFTSAEFRAFLTANGIRQTLTTPYHPSSNRLAA
uniref:Integrase catalytic domain-containing protein n=1 Tax=Amphimedon queenslandica TaxID=400682 RepID=A0A1X7V9S0_AMPQE